MADKNMILSADAEENSLSRLMNMLERYRLRSMNFELMDLTRFVV